MSSSRTTKFGAFCQTYGHTLRNRVLEHLLEAQDLDWAVGDIARETGISRPKAYELFDCFQKQGLVIPSRVVGRTQLYRLNKENARVRLLRKDFLECLRIVVEEYSRPSVEHRSSRQQASAKAS